MYEDLKIKIKEISKSKKIKVFYFGNTAGIEKNSFYLTTLRLSFSIIFSIALLGEGKSILSNNTIVIKNNKKTKTTLIIIFVRALYLFTVVYL